MRNLKYVILVIALVAVGYAGLRVGGCIFNRPSGLKPEDVRWVDEYQGLGERTGISSELVLSVAPPTIVVRSGQPVRLKTRLTNKGRRRLVLNSWLRPYPAYLENNQFPLKVSVLRGGKPLACRGSAEICPPHTRRDFFILDPGHSKGVNFDLAATQGSTAWDLTAPGEYQISIWYETYLTGRLIGVKAWTGRTNPVTVKVTVRP